MMRQCVGNKDKYQTGGQKAFWEKLQQYIKSTLNVDNKDPQRVIARIIKKHKEWHKEHVNDSGNIWADSDLAEATDQWIEFLNDLKIRKQTAESATKSQQGWKQHKVRQIQDNMSLHMREKCQHSSTSSDGDWDDTDDEAQIAESQATAAQTTDSELSQPSCKWQNHSSKYHEIALFNKNLKAAAKTMSAPLQSLISQSDSGDKSSTMKLQQDVKELKDQMRLMLQLLQQQMKNQQNSQLLK